jgi:hypothetical protein
MKLAISVFLLTTFAIAGNCTIEGRVKLGLPVITMIKHKIKVQDTNLDDCIELAKNALTYNQKHRVSICGGEIGGSCGEATLNGKITLVRFKYVEDEYKIKGHVKKN